LIPRAVAARKTLFAVQDWGLGHATRDLVLIRALLDAGQAVTVLSTGPALQLLQSELGERCRYVRLRDIPKPISRHAFWFHARMAVSLPLIFATWRRERAFVEQLWERERFDHIVSDSRFGVCLAQVPSYFLTHSLRQIVPGRLRLLENRVERAQHHFLAGARKILVPDEEADGGLAGALCHAMACDWGSERIEYLGILSSLHRQDVDQDVDCFISISGPEPQRTILERIIIRQAPELEGNIVIALGRPESESFALEGGRISIHAYLDRGAQEEVMNRARLVVSRSGYTTLMELAELGRLGLLVPTPGQTEQGYLAEHHERLGHLHRVRQGRLRLAEDVATARGYAGLPAMGSTASAVRRFLNIVLD
jgi:UDP:flavonoid glycosyltransferase YjiC (YdhE family)